ncbi:uncharacterized protein [Procambarus clarkii]|uniref:uncharacterized protein n=1 Tax=Procambarus clarkii TaxID=6728 RepID=UPI003742D5E3
MVSVTTVSVTTVRVTTVSVTTVSVTTREESDGGYPRRRSVVRGEVTAALRRTNNYAATHTLYQNGFRKGRAGADLLLNVFTKWHQSLDESKISCVVALDRAGAFDRVWHSGLAVKFQTLVRSQGHSEDVEEVLCPQRCQSSGSSLASQSSGPAGGADSFMQRLQRSYAHAAHGPPLPPTSNGRIGWRSSLPDLRLERYGACTSVKPMSPGHDQRHALSPRPSSAARPSLQ